MRERQHGRLLHLTSRHPLRRRPPTARGPATFKVEGPDTNVETDDDDGKIEIMTELLMEHASDLMFVGLAEAEGFDTEVKLRCEMKVAEYTTKWLQGKASGKGRDGEPQMLSEGPCLMETELKECRVSIKNNIYTPKTDKMNWEELRRGHIFNW